MRHNVYVATQNVNLCKVSGFLWHDIEWRVRNCCFHLTLILKRCVFGSCQRSNGLDFDPDCEIQALCDFNRKRQADFPDYFCRRAISQKAIGR